jgi:hypothetical protein
MASRRVGTKPAADRPRVTKEQRRSVLVLPRARRRFGRLRPVRLLQGYLDGIGVKVFGIPNVNGERLRLIAIQCNRHQLLAQGKRERTGCFAVLRRLIWPHFDCYVSARGCGFKTKRLWFWFDRHLTWHPGRRRSTRASREHKNDDAIGRDGGNSHETSSRYCGEPRLPVYHGRAGLRVSFGNVARLLTPTALLHGYGVHCSNRSCGCVKTWGSAFTFYSLILVMLIVLWFW